MPRAHLLKVTPRAPAHQSRVANYSWRNNTCTSAPEVTVAEVELPEARILRLQEGDVLLFQAPKHLSDCETEELVDQVKAVFPGHRAMVVDGDVKVTVARIEAR